MAGLVNEADVVVPRDGSNATRNSDATSSPHTQQRPSLAGPHSKLDAVVSPVLAPTVHSTRRQPQPLRSRFRGWATRFKTVVTGALRVMSYLASTETSIDVPPVPPSPSVLGTTATRNRWSLLTQVGQVDDTVVPRTGANDADIRSFNLIQKYLATPMRPTCERKPITPSTPNSAGPSFNVSSLTPMPSPQFVTAPDVTPAMQHSDDIDYGDGGLEYEYSDGEHEDEPDQALPPSSSLPSGDTVPLGGPAAPHNNKLPIAPVDTDAPSADVAPTGSSTVRQITQSPSADTTSAQVDSVTPSPTTDQTPHPPMATPPLASGSNQRNAAPISSPTLDPRQPSANVHHGDNTASQSVSLSEELSKGTAEWMKRISEMQKMGTDVVSGSVKRHVRSKSAPPTPEDVRSEDGLKLKGESSNPVASSHVQCECGMIGVLQAVQNHWTKNGGCPSRKTTGTVSTRRQKRYSLPLDSVHEVSNETLRDMIQNAAALEQTDPGANGDAWRRVRAWARLAHHMDVMQEARLLNTNPGRHTVSGSPRSSLSPGSGRLSAHSVASASVGDDGVDDGETAAAAGVEPPTNNVMPVQRSESRRVATQRRRTVKADTDSSPSISDSDLDSDSSSETRDPTVQPPSVGDVSSSESDDDTPTKPTSRTRRRQRLSGAGIAAPKRAAPQQTPKPPPASGRRTRRTTVTAAFSDNGPGTLEAAIQSDRATARHRSGSVSTVTSVASAGSTGSGRRTRSRLEIDYTQSIWQWFWMPVIHSALGRKGLMTDFTLKTVLGCMTAVSLVRNDLSSRGVCPGDISELPHSDTFVRVIVDPSLGGSDTTTKLDSESRAFYNKFGYTDVTPTAFSRVMASINQHLQLVEQRAMALGTVAGAGETNRSGKQDE